MFRAVEGRCKEPTVSKLAKSLLESVPSKRAQGPLPGISRGNIHDLHKAFSSNSSCLSIG